MNQSFQNKNNGNETCEIYVGDVVMVKMEKRFEDNPNVQIETSRNPKNEKEIMKV